MKITVKQIAYHRNGVAGEGFHVVLFTMHDLGEQHDMIAVLFNTPGQCAILDVQETANENIAFAQGNSWRGDDFEPELRKAIAEYQQRDI